VLTKKKIHNSSVGEQNIILPDVIYLKTKCWGGGGGGGTLLNADTSRLA